MESESPIGTFYIIDHKSPDLLAKDGDRVIRFASKQSALDCIKEFTSASGYDIKTNPTGISPGGIEEKEFMARTPKANADAVKAAAVADKRIGGKGGVKAAAKTADANKQLAAATGRKIGRPAKEPSEKAERLSASTGIKSVANRTGTMAHMFRDLIANQSKLKLTDEAIHEKVEAHFSKKIPSNAVAHYRADVEKRVAAGAAI